MATRQIWVEAMFSPDGHLVLTANEDSIAQLCDAQTGPQTAVSEVQGTLAEGHIQPGRKAHSHCGREWGQAEYLILFREPCWTAPSPSPR